MKTTNETITPVKAKQMLETHLWPFVEENPVCQRTRSERQIENFARMMRAGQWGLTHQGIAIDDGGLLVDGQHRLLAIIRSGKTVKMMVTRGLQSNGSGSNSGVHIIDMIDRGNSRNLGQQLKMRHGITDANYYAAMCRTIIMLAADAAKVQPEKVDVGQCLRVADHYGQEMEDVNERKSRITGLRSAIIGGSIAFALKVGNKTLLREFAERIADGENIGKGHPALTFRNYMLLHYKEFHGGRSYRFISRATLTAAVQADQRASLKKIKHSEFGYTYFMHKQRRTLLKLLDECGYRIS